MNIIRKAAVSAAVVATTLTGGAIGAALINGTAHAQTESPSSTTTADSATTADNNGTTTQQPAQPPQGDHRGPGHDPSQGGHQANGITEELLSGDNADKVTAAAKTAVPDGTIDRVETDAEGAPYEAHMTKADGSHVTVKVNSDFSVASIENGMR
jgi:hypothetical protein